MIDDMIYDIIYLGIGNKAEIFTKPSTAAQADFSRDTLAKALYSRLFDWLVHKINESIRKDGHQGIQIGVLVSTGTCPMT